MGAAIFVGNLRFENVIHLQFDSSGYNFVHAKHVTNRSWFIIIYNYKVAAASKRNKKMAATSKEGCWQA